MNLRAYHHPDAERLVEGMTRDEVCNTFRRRILVLARRVADQAGDSSPFTVEDLVGYGVMGLLEAFERFEPAQGVDFSSYASYRILGQMLDVQRSASGSTRRERQMSRDLAKALSELRAELGHEPTHEQLAGRMKIDMDEYWRMRGLSAPVALVPMPADEADPSMGVAEPDGPRRLLAEDARRALKDAIAALPEKERQVVLLYYARDCSLAEIGEILEVTPSRICQILSAARVRLRKAIGSALDVGTDFDLFSFEAVA